MLCMLLNFALQNLFGKTVQGACVWAPDAADLSRHSVTLWLTSKKVTSLANHATYLWQRLVYISGLLCYVSKQHLIQLLQQ